MKIGNMLYPQSLNSAHDATRIHECVQEAVTSEQLGVDTLWLAEHHFDGNSVYSDPVTFASHLAALTQRIKIGFAVLQTSLYHPVRLAEQLSLLDILSNQRVVVGLGRGTNGNIYEYQGYDLDALEAQTRYVELTEVLLKLWNAEASVAHEGTHWNLNVPALRPRSISRPHPPVIHASGSPSSVKEIASRGEPILMAPLSYDETARRLEVYTQTMKEAGYDARHIENALDQSWVWREVYVADSLREAQDIGLANFLRTHDSRGQLRRKVYAEQGLEPHSRDLRQATAENAADMGFLHGTVETMEKEFSRIASLGVGGAFGAFRLGGLTQEQATQNLALFMTEVAPRLR
ncbi:LLM class flavin-dependent oxidoreductase [Pseudomonas sp. v388]|uniref:LLM class flavin-dependent oxidoreductase n=1 Tax=Pseudomonas sp. v388 TaxID=2479849 RepID=UPI000F7819D2|nr:LLM class flavin-dependent oxidoreductase [Pseudomonas sp. v388]RRV10459.1 LLM class flavin-dependent oxidoreductase [Pseudomonas sp. v388]